MTSPGTRSSTVAPLQRRCQPRRAHRARLWARGLAGGRLPAGLCPAPLAHSGSHTAGLAHPGSGPRSREPVLPADPFRGRAAGLTVHEAPRRGRRPSPPPVRPGRPRLHARSAPAAPLGAGWGPHPAVPRCRQRPPACSAEPLPGDRSTAGTTEPY